MSKKQNLHTKFLPKNKLAESTDHEAGMSDATSTEVWSQNSDEGSGSKAEMSKFHDVWNSGFCGSFMIPVTMLRIVMFAERQAKILLAKPNLLPKKKKFKQESLVY